MKVRQVSIVIALVITLLVGTATKALAATGRVIIRPNLDMHAEPHGGTAVIKQIPYGVSVTIHCQEEGTAVRGPYGTTTLWDWVTYDGTSGFATDAFLFTNRNGRVAPDCGHWPPPPPPPPPFSLRLPVPDGATVKAGSPHPWDGVNGARSSVDFGPASGEMNVVAAERGTATVHGIGRWTRCWVTVTHSDGWQTRYMHLKSIPANLHGRGVAKGEVIGQAALPGRDTCGYGNFKHVHFALYRHGEQQAISGTSIGGYTVVAVGGNYCGYWRRNRDGAVVVDSRRTCVAMPGLVNNQ